MAQGSDSLDKVDEIAGLCSDCGNCLFACPVYQAELIEPTSPRGRVNLIKKIKDGELADSSLSSRFLNQCLLCGSCEHICPKGVEFSDLMIDTRKRLAKERRLPWWKKVVLTLYQSLLFRKGVGLLDLLAKTPLKKRFLIPTRRRARLGPLYTRDLNREFDVLLFPGCVLTYFYPELLRQTKTLLESRGFSVAFPRGLRCCGFPYISQGWQGKFEKLKRRNERIISSLKYKTMVIPCGTGVMTFRRFYGLAEDKVKELSQFLFEKSRDLKVSSEGLLEKGEKITFHDPCHQLKSLGLGQEPRAFMEQFGDRFVADEEGRCCGFGGLFRVGFPATSKKILKRRARGLEETGADVVVTSCPGCYLQMSEGLPQKLKFFSEIFPEPGLEEKKKEKKSKYQDELPKSDWRSCKLG